MKQLQLSTIGVDKRDLASTAGYKKNYKIKKILLLFDPHGSCDDATHISALTSTSYLFRIPPPATLFISAMEQL